MRYFTVLTFVLSVHRSRNIFGMWRAKNQCRIHSKLNKHRRTLLYHHEPRLRERKQYADKGSVVCFKLIFSDVVGFFFVFVFFSNQSPDKGWDSWYSAFWAGMTVLNIWREKMLPQTKERAKIECCLWISFHIENILSNITYPPNLPCWISFFFPASRHQITHMFVSSYVISHQKNTFSVQNKIIFYVQIHDLPFYH